VSEPVVPAGASHEQVACELGTEAAELPVAALRPTFASFQFLNWRIAALLEREFDALQDEIVDLERSLKAVSRSAS
jgi:hypothetical protein